MSAKTYFATQEGPANALALNKDNNHVVIAGRNVFKVFSIGEEEFIENYNLRVGKNLNLNFSCNDVAWNPLEDYLLATAATNGAVVLWNLSKSSRLKQEHVFTDHKRTVNKVSFHTSEPHWLISGSQDGTMKCFDVRTTEATRTFISNTESIRDVQFSPQLHHVFAAVSENGNVQLWDMRRPDRCSQQFTAHSGPVFACDWHPENNWLATASRDKTIKVWDLTTKPCLEYTINTIASVGRIRWRPQRKFHIASCSLVVDSSINVWDIRRPYIPFAAFNEHRDVATGLAWRGDPQVFLSTSRDCTLYHHVFKDACRPADQANPQGISLNNHGDVAYAYRVSPNTSIATRVQGFIRKTKGTSEQFCQAASTMHWFSVRAQNESRYMLESARRYILSGKSLAEMCDHNAAVAQDLGRHQINLVWSIIKTLYWNSREGTSSVTGVPALRDTHRDTHRDAHRDTHRDDGSAAGEASNTGDVDQRNIGASNAGTAANSNIAGEKNSVNNTVGNSAATGGTKQRDGTGTGSGNAGNTGSAGAAGGATSAANRTDGNAGDSAAVGSGNDDEIDGDDTTEIFQNGTPMGLPSFSRTAMTQGDFFFGDGEMDPLDLDSGLGMGGPGPGSLVGNGLSSSVPVGGVSNNVPTGEDWLLPSEAFPIRHEIQNRSPPPETFPNHLDTSEQDAQQVVMDEQNPALLSVPTLMGAVPWDGGRVVADTLRHHAVLGDIQTAASVLLVLGEHRRSLKLDEATQEHWLLGYIDWLARHQLWNISAQVIQLSWIPNVYQLNQQSTTLHTSCGRCQKPLQRTGWLCDRCHSSENAVCSICHQVVRGLYAWCQGCSHGGHLHHIQQWLIDNRQCPTGCGHICEYN